MLRSITFIKTIHTLAFILLSIANLALLYAALTGIVTKVTWLSIGLVLIEGIILMFNGWRCPLTAYTENLGAVSGQVTDIFLPKWFADRIFLICGLLFAFSVILFSIRIIASL